MGIMVSMENKIYRNIFGDVNIFLNFASELNELKMQVITNVLKVGKYDYCVKHLEMLNIILPEEQFPDKLSSKEIEVLAAFMSQEKNLIEEDMFNGVVRKKVMDKLSLKPGGLGNHLKKMIEKKFLTKNDLTKRILLKPFLYPADNHQGYRIKLVKV